MKANSWAARYGRRRRAIDKAILQEAERRLEAEEKAARPIPDTINPRRPIALNGEEINRIARAFGRPIART